MPRLFYRKVKKFVTDKSPAGDKTPLEVFDKHEVLDTPDNIIKQENEIHENQLERVPHSL